MPYKKGSIYYNNKSYRVELLSVPVQKLLMSQIKVIFKNETKKLKRPTDYETLHLQTVKAFGASLPKIFKFFYQDPEGDLISISCQEDLEEAYSSMSALRLIVESSIQEARNLLEPDFSMRSSSLNMPLQMSAQQNQSDQFQKAFESIPSIPHQDGGISHDFEEIERMEEQKSLSYQRAHSVAVGEEVP